MYRLPLMLITLVFLNGCFYMVDKGRHGVAERFDQVTGQPIYSLEYQNAQRLERSYIELQQLKAVGAQDHYPALLYRAEMIWSRARREHQSDLQSHSARDLDQLDWMINRLAIDLGVNAFTVNSLCRSDAGIGVCR